MAAAGGDVKSDMVASKIRLRKGFRSAQSIISLFPRLSHKS